MMISKDTLEIVIPMLAAFIIILVVMIPSLQNPQTSSTAIQTIIIIGIMIAVVIVLHLLRRGALPIELILNYLPFPLVLLTPTNQKQKKLFDDCILPAVNRIIKLTIEKNYEYVRGIIIDINDFFEKELNIPKSMKDVKSLQDKIKQIYVEIEDADTRKNATFALAYLILWVFRKRNLAAHRSPIRLKPDFIDAFFALRTSLIYLRDRYPVSQAVLYTMCPKCGKINPIVLNKHSVRWLKDISITCMNTKCHYEYTVKIAPKTIIKHYELLTSNT